MSQFTYDLEDKHIRSLPPGQQQKISPLEKYTLRADGGLFYLRDAGNGVEVCREVADGHLKVSRADTDCATEIFRFELLLEDLAIQGGKLTRAQLEEIAKTKEPDLTAADLDAAVRTIAGSARSMGLDVEGVV